MTRLSSGATIEGEQGVSAYVEALLERTADGLDDLTRTLRRESRVRRCSWATAYSFPCLQARRVQRQIRATPAAPFAAVSWP